MSMVKKRIQNPAEKEISTEKQVGLQQYLHLLWVHKHTELRILHPSNSQKRNIKVGPA